IGARTWKVEAGFDRTPAMAVRWMGAVSVALVTGGALAGCSTLLAVRGQQERADQNAVISGTVTTDHEPRGPLVVGLATRRGSEFTVVDYFVAATPGPWILAVAPGTYW